jgi:hypothetical protein
MRTWTVGLGSAQSRTHFRHEPPAIGTVRSFTGLSAVGGTTVAPSGGRDGTKAPFGWIDVTRALLEPADGPEGLAAELAVQFASRPRRPRQGEAAIDQAALHRRHRIAVFADPQRRAVVERCLEPGIAGIPRCPQVLLLLLRGQPLDGGGVAR